MQSTILIRDLIIHAILASVFFFFFGELYLLGSESSDLGFRYLLIYQDLKTLIFVQINLRKYGQRNYVRNITFGTSLCYNSSHGEL